MVCELNKVDKINVLKKNFAFRQNLKTQWRNHVFGLFNLIKCKYTFLGRLSFIKKSMERSTEKIDLFFNNWLVGNFLQQINSFDKF